MANKRSILKSNQMSCISTTKRVDPLMTDFYIDPLANEIKELKNAGNLGVICLTIKLKWSLNNDSLCGTDEMLNMEKHYLQVFIFFYVQNLTIENNYILCINMLVFFFLSN